MPKKIETAPTRSTISGYAAINLKDPETKEVLLRSRFRNRFENRSPRKGPFLRGLPKISRFRTIYELGCGVVHGIPNLYFDIDLDNLEIYIGRTTSENLYANASFKAQNNYDGMIPFAMCDMRDAVRFETLYQAIIMLQRKKDALCVKGILNRRAWGGGPMAGPTAVIYIAWRVSRGVGKIGFPDVKIRNEIANEVHDDNRLFEIAPSKESIVRALEAARRVRTCVHSYWCRTLN